MSSMMQRLLGLAPKGEPPSLEEELAEIKRKEQEDLVALEEEFSQRGPTEEDLRLQALQDRAQMLRMRRPKRRQWPRQGQALYAAAGAPAGQSQSPLAPLEAKLEAAEANAAEAFAAAQQARAAAEEAVETAQQVRHEAAAWAASQNAVAVAEPLQSGAWEAVFDVGSGRWYYYNQETQVTTWDVPTMAERPAEPPAPWQLVPDYNSCQWYYHDCSSGATSWQAP